MKSYFLAAFVFWILSILLVQRWLPFRFAAPILSVKFSIPVIYRYLAGQVVPRYNVIAADSWYRESNRILAEGHTPLSLLLEGFDPIRSIMSTSDPFYWWWTTLWISIIENKVYSPLLANVFVTVIGSVIVVALVGRLGYSYKYQQLFLVFTLLHWDILTWSSILNHKDPIVATITVSGIYLIIVALQTTNSRILLGSIISLSAVLLIVSTIRWYVPGLFLSALSMWLFIEFVVSDDKIRLSPPHIVGAGIIGVVSVAFLISWANVTQRIDLGYLLIGFFRYTLGPTPGGTVSAYTFLNPSAVFHWLFAPVAFLGAVSLLTKRFERLIIIYGLILVSLLSGVPAAAGPRFRFQFVFFIALFQFQGLWFLITRKYRMEIRIPDFSYSDENPVDNTSK
jgi:hypothetical protein